jgi:bromodomain-containing factor 1
MEKCNNILRFIREKDVERGAFFSEPVDPVALGIPTYYQVITEPMDLRTLHRKMEAEEVTAPDEFGRLCRLVFENAMTFNVDPTHSVHQAARNLLILFNQKYRDVERMITTLRRLQTGSDAKKKEGKDGKKRRRGTEDFKSPKQQRLDEAQDMAAANASAMSALVAAVPGNAASAAVTRNEFNLMLHMIQQLQQQVVQTYTVLADTLSDDIDMTQAYASQDMLASSAAAYPPADYLPPPVVPDKKKPVAKKPVAKPVEKPVVVEDDYRPLTLQEQELLTETINELPADHLHGVIQIIREAAKLTGEEDEIDLEIDQLDTATQRKLLQHVSKVSHWKRSWIFIICMFWISIH